MSLPTLQDRVRQILKGRFVAGVLTLASGTMIGQVVTVMATPILSRLFTPSDFAALGVFAAMLAVLGAVSTFRYELGAITAKNLPLAASALALALTAATVVSGLTTIVCYALADTIAQRFNVPALAPWLWLLGPALLFTAWQLAMSFWVTRRGLYRNQAYSEIARAVGTALSQMLMGLAGLAAAGLVIGRLIGLVAAALITGVVTLRPDFAVIARAARPRRLYSAAIRFRKLAFFQVPKALINVLTNQLPIILIAANFGAIAAGLYWFVQRLLFIPVNFLGGAVQRVFLKTVSERHNSGRPFAIQWAKSTVVLLIIGCCGSLVVAAIGPAGFRFLFGSQWSDAWYFAIWVTIWFTFRVGTAPSQAIYIVMDQQATQFAIESIAAVIRLSIIPIGAQYFAATTVVAIYSMAGATLNLLIMIVAGVLAFRHKRALPRRGQ